MELVKKPCGKCDGTGFLPEYRHIHAGRCFACNGKGFFLVDPYKEEKNEKRREKTKQAKEEKHNIIREYNQTKTKKFIEDMQNDSYFIKTLEGRNPLEEGYPLAQNLMRYYESKNIWSYDVPKPF